MNKQIYINLPVSDLQRSTAFYEALGFVMVPEFSSHEASAMKWSDEIMVMLLVHPFYLKFPRNRTVADTQKTSAVLMALGLESREAVEAFAQAAKAQGGDYYRIDTGVSDEMMFGYEVEDLDGHIWEPMWMNPNFVPSAE